MTGEEITRRSVLGASGAIAGAGLFTGVGSGETSEKPERYIIGTKSNAGQQAAERAANAVRHRFDFESKGKAVAGRFSKQAREALANRPDVRYIEPDGNVDLLGQTVDWGIKQIGATTAQDNGYNGGGADIAIIDTGIDSDHPDLVDNLGEGHAIVSCSDCKQPWDDLNGHGTHVAGIAGAVDNTTGVLGVAPGCTLHAVKVADDYISLSDVAKGIEVTANQGYDVGNLSLGTSSDYSTLQDACQYAYDNGVLLVGASGNDDCSDCVLYPAAYSSVIAVTASNDDNQVLYFSNTGPEVEFTAPGGDPSIYSTEIGGYDYKRGTSMASPHVAGSGALLMAEGYSNTEARDRLQATATDIGYSDNKQGYGLVDPEEALSSGSTDASVSVSTQAATDVGTDAATFNGDLTDLGGASSADVAFEYRESGTSTWATTTTQTLSATGSFSESVSGLSATTEYEYRAVATASDGDTDTGTTVSFTTSDTAVSVSTDAATEVTDSGSTLNGTLSGLGGADSADCSFEWRESGASTWNTTATQTLSTTGSFSETISGLSSGVEYEYRAVATASDGDTDTGVTTTFTTSTDPDVAVSTSSATNVSETAATFNGSLDDLGGASSADCYFKFRQTGADSWSTTGSVTRSATGDYSHDVSGLTDGTEYEFYAIATASDGDTSTGSMLTCTTDSSGGTAPAIDRYTVTEAGSPNPHCEITADWAVSDADADLDTVEVAVLDSSGATLRTDSASVGGSSGSGSDKFKIKHVRGQTFDVVLAVADSSGRTTTQSQAVSE